MSRYTARVTSWWVTDADDIIKPDLGRLIQPGDSMMDSTGQGIMVNSPVVVECWIDATTLDAIERDDAYGPGAILWAKEEPDVTNP
jgi:hypothetical protein